MQSHESMNDEFQNNLFTYILQPSFPCIMAKAVANKGFFHSFVVPEINDGAVEFALNNLQEFVSEMHSRNQRLSSCAVILKDEKLKDFKAFEEYFWFFLKELNKLDKKNYQPDPTVDADPQSSNFSYSIKSESFFIIALHPDSPRWSRRFKYPAIVFNPHKQFEEMRSNGTYQKVRDLIRKNDKLLQGSVNPMLHNFGEKSEVFQYLGVEYNDHASVPLIF